MSQRGKFVVVSGPSGVGKSTIVAEVRRRTGADFSVSATTRPPRAGEVDGRDYRFVDRPAFERMIAAGELLEWADVFGQLYGTPAGPLRAALEAGRTVVQDLDVQGAVQVHQKVPQAVFVLILPPDEGELARRLARRGTETPEIAARRLAKAVEEIRLAKASGVYDYEIVNDDLPQAVERVVEIVKHQE